MTITEKEEGTNYSLTAAVRRLGTRLNYSRKLKRVEGEEQKSRPWYAQHLGHEGNFFKRRGEKRGERGQQRQARHHHNRNPLAQGKEGKNFRHQDCRTEEKKEKKRGCGKSGAGFTGLLTVRLGRCHRRT